MEAETCPNVAVKVLIVKKKTGETGGKNSLDALGNRFTKTNYIDQLG